MALLDAAGNALTEEFRHVLVQSEVDSDRSTAKSGTVSTVVHHEEHGGGWGQEVEQVVGSLGLGQTEGCFCGNEQGAVAVAWYLGEILSQGLAAFLKHCNEDDQGDLVDSFAGKGAVAG